MSGGGTGQGALYSPLPQSISDTDSSEEELISVVHHNDNRKLVVSGKESVDKRNGQKMGDYRPLGHDNEHDVAINGFPARGPTTADDVPIIKSEGPLPRHLEPMSTLRKIFFVLSILLCGFTIVIFLWVLPCDWATCPSAPVKSGTKAWERTLNKIELKGGISVVPGVIGRGHNLVFLMRGDVMSPLLGDAKSEDVGEKLPPNGGGLINLIGSSGKIAWWKPLHSLPHDMDCSLLDVTNDGVNDCIVVGADTLFATVEPLSGSIIWHVHVHDKNGDKNISPVNIDFPVILPDLNNDGVSELVASCSIMNNKTESEHNYFILISGKSGALLGNPLRINNCPRISNLVLETDWNITYTCQDYEEKESTIVMSIQELYTKTTTRPLPSTINLTKFREQPLKQHPAIEGLKQNDRTGKSNRYTVGGRRLTLENQGRCPTHCSTTVRVFDERAGRIDEMVWNYTGENTYAMIPAMLTFNRRPMSGGNSTMAEPVSGFVLKLWQWNVVNSKHVPFSNEGEEDDEISTKPLYRTHLKLLSLEDSMAETSLKDENAKHRTRRNVHSPLQQNPKCPPSNVTTIHQLNERVVLITFNATDMHIVNTSQSDITQLCTHQESTDERPNCQPDLAFQEQSLLIADLDEDGSQELISYLTTFVSKGQDGGSVPSASSTWQLHSKVRVIRLEAELPKLYEAVAHQ